MTQLASVISFILNFKKAHPEADKERVQSAYIEQFKPEQRRSVFVGPGFSIRFSEAKTGSFSNTVLSLSALQSVDDQPMVVCVVRPNGVEFMLANATFLRKVSHSSHRLRVDNVKGSFNGTDIATDYGGVDNRPENFEQLFGMHAAFTWAENLERLVEATNAIVGRDNRFRPTEAQRAVVLAAGDRAATALLSAAFRDVELELHGLVDRRQAEILRAAAIDNVNIRGNAIEQVVTSGANAHELGDLVRDLASGGRLVVDVKTKLADRASAPKAYNIDKMLAFHAEPGSVFAFLMLLVDLSSNGVVTRLVPVLDSMLLDATGIQHHWAGRTSRGVTQLSGRFDRVLDLSYAPRVDVERARAFLSELLDC